MIIPPFLLESSALWATEYSSVITWFPMTYNVQRTTYNVRPDLLLPAEGYGGAV